ncbi:MFS transporter [Crocinitomix algicola]|uniref:MFS transporter n=1 Tax=Crocinitomix algicola TaxID=1740263 RepID=UPI00082DC17E|nr:MFS transporter [Crocinitomix algicola]
MIVKGDKKTMNGWAFYDWANSVYPLVISTAIFPIFYEKMTSSYGPNEEVISDLVTFFGLEIKNTVLYSYVVAASFIMVCILSPILSGIADYSGSKKRFLQFFCYLGALSTATLFFFNPAQIELSMLSLFLASVGFWNSLVFYNAYLPEVAPPEDHDRLSAKGFALGYGGASILLIACLILIQIVGMPAKYAFILTGIWWIGFSQFTYRILPNASSKNKVTGKILGNGFRELLKVGHFIRTTKRLKRYLISFFLFSMGVQTVMLIAVLFAKKEVFVGPNANEAGLIIAVLLIQFIAIPGAYAFSWSAKKIGNVKTLGVALFIWSLCCTYAYLFVYDEINFYILAGIVGFVMGGTQALSRSTYSKYLPETKDTASFFSFYDITEKIGIVLGMIIFGYVEASSGHMRTSVLALITFFILGFVALFFIPKEEKSGVLETVKNKV